MAEHPPRDDDESTVVKASPGAGADSGLEHPPRLMPGDCVGRYTLKSLLGSGGMGEVFAANDPELDRVVALKVIQGSVGGSSPTARARFQREAQAMARLSHPNVVSVFDVGSVGDHVYVTMELVEGPTLAAWLAERERPWKEVLEVFLQAGRGLEAAHAAGIVHRDFKPANVIVGDRVRVADFGLARSASEVETPRPVSPGAFLDVAVTTTGQALGTPAYMAPEQRTGSPTDARTDQYAFCLCLWEALTGERPEPGPALPRDRRAPAWLFKALARGLAERPADRWPSMTSLLAVLRRSPGRRLLAAGVAVAVVALAAAGFVGGRLGASAPCEGAELTLWDGAAQARVQAAFEKTARPYAKDTFTRVDGSLKRRVAAWSQGRRSACEATFVRHEQSDTLLDLRMRCLDRARAELASLVTLLGDADVGVVDRAAQAAAGAGDIEACADVAALAAAAPPPVDPAKAPKLEALRAEVARVTALRRLGKWKDALPASRELVKGARELAYPPVLAPALRLQADSEVTVGDLEAGIAALYETATVAAAARQDELAAVAANELVYALGVKKQRFEAAEVAFHLAEAADARAGNAPRLRFQLIGHRGQTLFRQGDFAAALPFHQQALALAVEVFGSESQEVAMRQGYVAATLDRLGRLDEAGELYRQALAVAEKAVGPEHPYTAILTNNFGVYWLNRYDFEHAAEYFERAIALDEKLFPENDPTLAEAVHNLGKVRLYQRRLPEARALVERALKSRLAKLGPAHTKVGESDELLAQLERLEGHPDRAHQVQLEALGIQHKLYGKAHPKLASLYQGDTDFLLALGRVAEARAAAERAMDIDKATIGEDNPDHWLSLQALGDVLRAEGKPKEAVPVYARALALAEQELGKESSALVDVLVGQCEALLAAGEAGAAVAAGERAVKLAARAPGDARGKAQFALARALWGEGKDLARARALAREAKATLGGLGFPTDDGPRVERWLAEHRER